MPKEPGKNGVTSVSKDKVTNSIIFITSSGFEVEIRLEGEPIIKNTERILYREKEQEYMYLNNNNENLCPNCKGKNFFSRM